MDDYIDFELLEIFKGNSRIQMKSAWKLITRCIKQSV